MASTRPVLTLVTLLAAACTAPGGRLQESHPEPRTGGFRERIVVEAMLIPGAWIWRDADGGAPRPEEENATGEALRVALGSRDESIGVLFQNFRSDDDALDVQTFGLDFDARTALDEGGRALLLRAGAGIGTCWFDTPTGPSEQDLAAQLRLGLDVQPTESFAISMAFGGLVLGYPGSTEAYGTFVTLGAVLTF